MVRDYKLLSRALLLCVVATFMGSGARIRGEDVGSVPLSEYKIKAAYLYYFATFVAWPQETLPHNGHGLVIGILGDDPFGSVLEETIQGKLVNSKPLTVKRFVNIKEARESQILFISSSEQDNLSYILKALDGSAVLTIGEVGDFASRGGQIGFRTEDKKVRFDINAGAVKRAGLKLSSQLMKLGKIVESSERQGG